MPPKNIKKRTKKKTTVVDPIQIIKKMPSDMAFEIGQFIGRKEAEEKLRPLLSQIPSNYYDYRLTTPIMQLNDMDQAIESMRRIQLYEEPMESKYDQTESRLTKNFRCMECDHNKRRCKICSDERKEYKSMLKEAEKERISMFKDYYDSL